MGNGSGSTALVSQAETKTESKKKTPKKKPIPKTSIIEN